MRYRLGHKECAVARGVEVGPGQFRLWVNEAGISPHFIAGTVTATLRASGAMDPKVEIAEFDGHECTYLISF